MLHWELVVRNSAGTSGRGVAGTGWRRTCQCDCPTVCYGWSGEGDRVAVGVVGHL